MFHIQLHSQVFSITTCLLYTECHCDRLRSCHGMFGSIVGLLCDKAAMFRVIMKGTLCCLCSGCLF